MHRSVQGGHVNFILCFNDILGSQTLQVQDSFLRVLSRRSKAVTKGIELGLEMELSGRGHT